MRNFRGFSRSSGKSKSSCGNCGYFCTLPLGKGLAYTSLTNHCSELMTLQGHTQQEHETSHGPMTQTRWALDGPDGVSLELGGRKFSSNDEGAPMMCNLVCSSMGRHVHIDYCRTEANGPCNGAELQHVDNRIAPSPDRPKDAVTHSLYWRRMGSLGELFPEARSKLKSYSCRLQRSRVHISPNTPVLIFESRPIHQRRTSYLCQMVCDRYVLRPDRLMLTFRSDAMCPGAPEAYRLYIFTTYLSRLT